MALASQNTPLDEQLLPGPETRHAWVIDIDHNATTTAKAMLDNLAGVGGPRGTIGLPIEKPDRYRLLDADGKVIVEGRTNTASISAASDGKVDGFEPLDDLGIGKFIEYLRGDKWVRLLEGE